jgi:hypothetical protein
MFDQNSSPGRNTLKRSSVGAVTGRGQWLKGAGHLQAMASLAGQGSRAGDPSRLPA